MMSTRAYLDNAATSFPKPACVHEAMLRYATEVGASPGRGAYAESREGARLLDQCRSLVCDVIGADGPERVIFTLNTSDALNLALKGSVLHRIKAGADLPVHVVTTAMDHNSVLRPLNALEEQGLVEWTCVPADPRTGLVRASDVAAALRSDTALVAVVHASNVSGSVQPIAEIGRVCRERGVPFVVDAAQSVGHLPVDVRSMHIDLLAFPGHKGLLGPLGTGGLWMSASMPDRLESLREGGTGSRSESDRQPLDLPDKYEPGSHNTVGLVGLAAGLGWLMERGIDRVRAHEVELMEAFLEAAPREEHGYRLLGPDSVEDRCAVFALAHEALEPASIAEELEAEHGILARAGVHCAPRAHETFGTHDRGGAVRLSFGPFTTLEEVRRACCGLRSIAERATAGA